MKEEMIRRLIDNKTTDELVFWISELYETIAKHDAERDRLREACNTWLAIFNTGEAERKRVWYALQDLYDTCPSDPGTPLYKEYQLALLRAESELQDGGL